MKINGSLVFDSSSASVIQNLRIEKFAVNPTHSGAADVGRLIYNSANGIIYVGISNAWVPLATGGDAAALMAEVDALEASLGSMIKSDGTFDASVFSGNLAGAASVKELFTKLQDALASEASARSAADTVLQGNIDTVSSDLAAEVARATAAEGVLTSDLAAEVAARQAADTTLTNNLAAEVVRATGEEARIEGLVSAEVTRATAAEATLTTNLAAEVARATAAEAALDAAVDAEEAARIAADTALQTAITAEQTRATAAETALSDRVTQEVADRTAADTALATSLAAEAAAREAADDAFQSALDAEIAARAAADVSLNNKIESAIAGLTWENPVDVLAADHMAVGAEGRADGFRVVNTTDFKIYTVTGEQFDNGEALVDGAAFFNRATDVPYVFNGTAVVQFNGANGLTAGAGLVLDGNTLNIASTSGTITVSADSIDVAQSVLDSISTVATNLAAEVTRAETAEAGLSDRIDDEVAARQAADVAMEAAYQAADTQLAADIAAETAARIADVDAEEARALAAEALIQSAVTAEVTRATAAEAALQTAISAEATRATAAEAALGTRVDGVASDLATEVSRATAAEGALQTALTAEVTRATAAEAALDAKIGKMYFLYDGSTAAASHTVTHNLGQKYCNVTVVSEDEVVIPQSVSFGSANELTVTFNTAIACKVIVMGLA